MASSTSSALRQARRSALLAQVETTRLHQRLERRHADELGAGHDETELRCLFARRFEDFVEWRGAVTEEIDRNLCLAVLLDVPPDCTHRLETARHAQLPALLVGDNLVLRIASQAPRFTDVERNFVGQFLVARIDVDVVGDEELACADDRGAEPLIEDGRARIRSPGGIGELLAQALVLAGADVGEVTPPRSRCRVFIEIDRQRQRLRQAATERPGRFDALIHRHAGNRHDRADVERAHARVGALVLGHVDEASGGNRAPECRIADGSGCADEGVDRAIRVGARVDIEEPDAADARNRPGDCVDHRPVTPLGEVRNALDEWGHQGAPPSR